MAGRVLVGRTKELARLHGALVDAQSGPGQVVLIVGEAGIGKTHLARASLAAAARAGMTVGIGRAWQGAGAPAFYIWSAALDAIGRPFKLQRALTADTETFAACERIAAHVRGLCGDNPTAILLDDLQWAELPALLALRLLVQNMPERQLLVGTVRIPEPMEPPIGDHLQEIMREADVISLGGLELDDLQAMPESNGLARETVAAVHRATAGNPFFARELLVDVLALEQMSFDEARSLLEFAASADERAGRVAGAVQALATLSEAMTSAGESDRGAHVAARALELAGRSHDPHALARAALAMTQKRRLGETDSSMIQLLEEALRAIDALGPNERDATLKCAVEARLASALQPFVDPPRALSLGHS